LGEEAALMDFVDDVRAHPPSTAFLPQQFREHAVETVREVRAKDLTVPQRLFVASLAPHSTAFATRSPADKWSDTMRAQDQKQLNRFLKQHNVVVAVQEPGDGASAPALRGRARPCHNGQRRRRRSSVFDLPDDLVERIVCIHLAQSMDRAEEAQRAAAHARYVNRQFRRTTNAAIARMLRTVTEATHSLLGPRPREPAEVQRILHAAGLTLRHALTMPPVRWRSYVRRRMVLEKHDSGREPLMCVRADARQRCALLWGILEV
jgi:AraC-like DNA-binding protein